MTLLAADHDDFLAFFCRFRPFFDHSRFKVDFLRFGGVRLAEVVVEVVLNDVLRLVIA